MYKVYDSAGGLLRVFPTFKEANKFRLISNRPDWTIKEE